RSSPPPPRSCPSPRASGPCRSSTPWRPRRGSSASTCGAEVSCATGSSSAPGRIEIRASGPPWVAWGRACPSTRALTTCYPPATRRSSSITSCGNPGTKSTPPPGRPPSSPAARTIAPATSPLPCARRSRVVWRQRARPRSGSAPWRSWCLRSSGSRPPAAGRSCPWASPSLDFSSRLFRRKISKQYQAARRRSLRLGTVKPNTRSFYVQAVGRALEAIATHLDDALELEALAASAGLSPFHFHRVFRGMVGETPMELARRLRLERAAFQLVSTELSVTQLAFAAGYETHEAFTRAFRAHYGLSPSDYRRRREARIVLAAPSGVHFGAEGIDVTFHPQDTGGSQMHVEITHQPRLRVATVRHVGPYNRISEAFGRLGALAGPAGL